MTYIFSILQQSYSVYVFYRALTAVVLTLKKRNETTYLRQFFDDVSGDDVIENRLQKRVGHRQDQLQLVAVPDQDLGLLQGSGRDL